MAQDRGIKWVIGCGSAVVIVIVAVVMLAFIWGRKAMHVAQEKMETEMEWVEFSTNWKPPEEPQKPESWFPADYRGYTRLAMDEGGAPSLDLPELKAGMTAAYEMQGGTVAITVLKMDDAARDALISAAKTKVDSGPYSSRFTVQMGGNRFTYRASPPDQRGAIWGSNGWVVYLRSDVEIDTDEELRDYLEYVDGLPAP